MLERARDIGSRRPAFDPKQRLAGAAAELNQAGSLQAQIEVCEAALVALATLLYATDADGQPANIDPLTGRILIALPWGSKGWRRWGLRKPEANHLRQIMIARSAPKRGGRAALFCYAPDSNQWYLDCEAYPTHDLALAYIKAHGPQLGEWRAVVTTHREAEAERLRTLRSR